MIDHEFGNALRGLLLGRKIELSAARADFADLPIRRYPAQRDGGSLPDLSMTALGEELSVSRHFRADNRTTY